MDTYYNYMIVTGGLIVLSLWLNAYQPPIKKQWIGVIIFIVGIITGWSYLHNGAYGFLISGLVFYKEELVEEVGKVVKSFKGIKEETHQNVKG